MAILSPGRIVPDTVRARNLLAVVREILRRCYDLQHEAPWSIQPGRDGVFLTKGQRRAREQEEKMRE